MGKRDIAAAILGVLLTRQRRGFQALRSRLRQSAIVAWGEYWLSLGQQEAASGLPQPNFSFELARFLTAFPLLRKDSVLMDAANQARSQHGLPLFACLCWLESIRYQLRWPVPSRNRSFAAWWQRNAGRLYLEAEQSLQVGETEVQGSVAFADRPFGVNLVGHAFSVFGLGETVRLMAVGLEAAQIPYCIRDIPSLNGASDQDRSVASKVLASDQPLPYAFTLFCMTASSQLDTALRHGLWPGRHTYTIANWFWETERWPEPLIPALRLVDEFWPCTRLIETALQEPCRKLDIPVVRIPPVLDISSMRRQIAASRAETRAVHGLPPSAVLFVFSFDLRSMISRKNPQAVLEAFQRAFGDGSGADVDSDVGLVIKSFPPTSPNPAWDRLKAIAAADARIKIVEANMNRQDLLALYQCCDCFVSLHRSEGLGQAPAEALQLGLDVIATDYGGNTDYCDGPLAHPIPYRLVAIKSGEYPFPQDQVWADPDVAYAAQAMQRVAHQRRHQPSPDPSTVASYSERFSAAPVGRLYKQRLEALWSDRSRLQALLDARYGTDHGNQALPALPPWR